MEAREKLYGLSLRYLTVRGRSRWEMTEYLTRKGGSEEDVEAVIARLEEAGLINDGDFARSWVAGRQAVTPRSKRRLAQELGAKRVPREVIDEVLREVGADEQLEAITQLARKKLRLPQYRDGQKLVSYLTRQGFGYGQVKEALERLGVSLR